MHWKHYAFKCTCTCSWNNTGRSTSNASIPFPCGVQSLIARNSQIRKKTTGIGKVSACEYNTSNDCSKSWTSREPRIARPSAKPATKAKCWLISQSVGWGNKRTILLEKKLILKKTMAVFPTFCVLLGIPTTSRSVLRWKLKWIIKKYQWWKTLEHHWSWVWKNCGSRLDNQKLEKTRGLKYDSIKWKVLVLFSTVELSTVEVSVFFGMISLSKANYTNSPWKLLQCIRVLWALYPSTVNLSLIRMHIDANPKLFKSENTF